MMCGDKIKSASCGKLLLIVVNACITIFGLALISMGVWLLINGDATYYTQLTRFQPPVSTKSSAAPSCDDCTTNKEATSTPSAKSSSTGEMTSHTTDHSPTDLAQWVVLTVAGSCIVVAALIGCCGACADNVWLLGSGLILTVILIVAEAVFIGFSVGHNYNYSGKLLNNLQNQIRYHYNATARPPDVTNTYVDRLTLAWNSLQTELQCCGASDHKDYTYSVWYNNTPVADGMFVPWTCCRQELDKNYCQIEAILNRFNRDLKRQNVRAMHDQGCHGALMQRLDAHRHTVIGLCTLTGILQIVCCILASFMICARKKNSHSTCA